jgi:peptide deformylase
MSVREVLLLGDPRLYEICEAVVESDLTALRKVVTDLHDTLMDCRQRIGAGRAIAAPQIGVMKRLVYMHIDQPVVFCNPVLDEMSDEQIEIWDDCLSFPDLLVRVQRHRRCRIRFRDLAWNERQLSLEDDLSELLQHECDHLNGLLAVTRAMDDRSFMWRRRRGPATGIIDETGRLTRRAP